MVDMCPCTNVQTHRMYYTERKLYDKLWTPGDGDCQHRFIVNFKKSTILVHDVDNGEGFVCVGKGNIWEIFVPSA